MVRGIHDGNIVHMLLEALPDITVVVLPVDFPALRFLRVRQGRTRGFLSHESRVAERSVG